MAYTMLEVRKEFIHTCYKAGVTINDVPIELNKRFIRTLGRVHYSYDEEWDKYRPTKVEFSEVFLKNATDQEIHDVILHEAAHFIVVMRTGETHGHDKVFKQVCKEIGTTNDKTSMTVESMARTAYKYTVICPHCGKAVGGFSRMCKTLRHLDECKCLYCKHVGLEMEQNW